MKKIINKKKSPLTIILKLYKNNEMVYNARLDSKTRVFSRAQMTNFTKGYIKVVYSYKHNYYNDADFTTLDQLKALLDVFTQKELITDFTKE